MMKLVISLKQKSPPIIINSEENDDWIRAVIDNLIKENKRKKKRDRG